MYEATTRAPFTTFTAPITKEGNSGWTCVVMPDSGHIFGTRRPVRVAGTVDGHSFEATLLPLGDGTHLVPLKAQLREVIDKAIGEDVTVHLARRSA
jgi:hypothetical protein